MSTAGQSFKNLLSATINSVPTREFGTIGGLATMTYPAAITIRFM